MSERPPTHTQWFLHLLRCPDCTSPLTPANDGFACANCGFCTLAGRDLRPRHPIDVTVTFCRVASSAPEEALRKIDLSAPDLTFVEPRAARDSRELMSEVKARLPAGGAALDLGCGPRDQSAPLEYLGFRYVGVDYAHSEADLLGDAHAIPFADDSFDCIFSYAVLEHLHNPFVALREVGRVLRPGGWFIGTVSQGEPFHSSYFHHTPWALLSLVRAIPDMHIHRLWPSSDTLSSLASMGRYSRVLKLLLAFADVLNTRLPWLTPRKMKWPEIDRQLDRLYRAGSICFAIQKTNGAPPGVSD